MTVGCAGKGGLTPAPRGPVKEYVVVILGVVLLVIGLIAAISVLVWLGIVLIVLGIVLNMVPMGGTRRRVY